MKINVNKNSDRPAFLDKAFTVKMTGEELLRMWLLSYLNEGGEQYPVDSNRFCNIIMKYFNMTNEELKRLSERLQNGKFV